MFFICRSSDNSVRLSTEHDTYEWIEPANSRKFGVISPDDMAIKSYTVSRTRN